MNPGTILRPIGKFFSVRVTSCSLIGGRAIRIEGKQLRPDMVDSGTIIAMNLIKYGDYYLQVGMDGMHHKPTMSRFYVVKPDQLELFEL